MNMISKRIDVSNIFSFRKNSIEAKNSISTLATWLIRTATGVLNYMLTGPQGTFLINCTNNDSHVMLYTYISDRSDLSLPPNKFD